MKEKRKPVVILKEDLQKRKIEINEIKKKAEEARLRTESANNERIASLNEDLRYFKREIVAKQKNGKYCKFSKPANSITAYNLSLYDILSYWLKNAENKKASVSYKEEVLDVFLDKIVRNPTPLKEVIELENNSNDSESAKKELIKIITSKK